MFRFILENTDESTTNIICTGSPEDYVKYMSEALGWSYLSSTLSANCERLIHMHGKNKMIALKSKYPKKVFTYRLAISDNVSDCELLRSFDRSYHIKNSLFTNEFQLIRVK